MKKGLILISIFLSHISLFGQKHFLDYFPEEKIISDSINYRELFTSIPEELVLNYLCNERNDCFINPYNGYILKYYPLYKVNFKEYWLILYFVSDGYSIDTYLASYLKLGDKISYKLHIYSDIGGEKATISYVINKDFITIFRTVRRYPEKVIIKEVYKLDAFLNFVSTDSPFVESEELPAVIPDYRNINLEKPN